MAGIYIHIPFCKTRCHYCDFYKSTETEQIDQFIGALKQELINRKHEINQENINTIYFGGGTPSVLSISQLNDILDAIASNYTVNSDAEITMECNPDDLNPKYLQELKTSRVNRLSIGTQSFQDCDLKVMNRRHNGVQAQNSVRHAQHSGFDNISIDLIYGLPNMTLKEWKDNLALALTLDVPHISAYHLTYHKGTVFYDKLQKHELAELDDELSYQQFMLLQETLIDAGYEQYEISNFARNGQYSKHNKAYWQQEPYLGLGPSAHSYDLKSRRWNISSVEEYIRAIANDEQYYELEELSLQDHYNDYIITSLRTKWGIAEDKLESDYPQFKTHFEQQVAPYLKDNKVMLIDGVYTLSTEGLFLSDRIMQDLIFVD